MAVDWVEDVEPVIFKLENASVTALVTVLNGLAEAVPDVPKEPALPKRALPNPVSGAADVPPSLWT